MNKLHRDRIAAALRKPRIQVSCAVCGTKFELVPCQHRKGTRCCSKSCATTLSNYTSPRNRSPLTPFTWFMRIARREGTKWKLSKSDLKTVWDRQDGRCPYTGWLMELPVSGRGYRGSSQRHRRASLDRKDPSKDYTVENVQWVSMIANYAKNNFAENALADFVLSASWKTMVSPTTTPENPAEIQLAGQSRSEFSPKS